MRLKRSIRGLIFTLVVLVCAPIFFYNFILDWHDRPYCHKQVMGALLTWMSEKGVDINTFTNEFPNVGGVGRDSLAVINDEMASTNWSQNYRYVPGLRENDPGYLVLMYLDRPTRWTWHGRPPTIFKDKDWILVPVDFAMGGRHLSGPGELSERVTTDEFKRRLRETIDFVRTNARPNWQTIVAEQTKFLESIESSSR